MNKFIDLSKGRASAKELAKKIGCSERQIRNYIAKPREEYLEERRNIKNMGLSMLIEGRSISEVADTLDVSRMTVHRWAKSTECNK